MTQQTLREETRCYSPLATRAILYNGSIGGKQVFRDDMWAVTTKELNDLNDKLARFKEFAETMIGEDENHIGMCAGAIFGNQGCVCGAGGRNALRNEQRKILSEKLK